MLSASAWAYGISVKPTIVSGQNHSCAGLPHETFWAQYAGEDSPGCLAIKTTEDIVEENEALACKDGACQGLSD